MKEVKYVYKIRRKSDGLYSKGGSSPTFSKNGKTWNTIGQLKSHLTLVKDGLCGKPDCDRLAAFYHDCNLITYIVSSEETGYGTLFPNNL